MGMSYSIDLRERAVKYVREGGSQTSASKLFKVGRRTLYDWLQRESLEPKKPSGRKRKLSKEALAADELTEPSLIIMDNAPFHNKNHIRDLLENKGHTLLPLPKYSPDLNPIEQSFAILKKRRQFSGLNIQQLLGS